MPSFFVFLTAENEPSMSSLFIKYIQNEPQCAKDQNLNRICYMILPDGVKKGLAEGLGRLSERYGISIVVIEEVNWNDDLTPWPADGVFRKAKPFGGKATAFLKKLANEIIPEAEEHLGVVGAERTFLGVSLSGLFAVWSAFSTDVFTNIISISGSLWYDGFTLWMKENKLSDSVESVCLLLGDREQHSKEKRMATVLEQTQTAADILKRQSVGSVVFELVEGTHFSPLMPRLEKAFGIVFG